MEKTTSFLIVGGSGTFGLSAAWHLARAGYCNIHCLDRWPVPSPSSAGYDRNKVCCPCYCSIAARAEPLTRRQIVRTEYGNPAYTELAQEAIELWKDPMFKDVFHQTGWLFGTDGSIELGRAPAFHQACANTRTHGDASGMVHLESWDAAIAKFPILGSDPRHAKDKAGFQAVYNENAGWVEPLGAMRALERECKRLGVKFTSGVGGTVVELLQDQDGKSVMGVRTRDGRNWIADKTIIAAGCYSDTLLDFKNQLQAVAYVVTHVQMTEDQYHRYKDLPVLNISRRGYSFPPNEDRVFKIVNTDISYINTLDTEDAKRSWAPISVPRDPAYHPTDTQPDVAYTVTREFMQYILPEFVDAPVHSSRLCWDMESFDYNWLIGPHPDYPASLIIATGGSGHSFKNMVNVGKYIVQAAEGVLDDRYRNMWCWRPDRIGSSFKDEERFLRPKLELNEATGWKHS